ncbi:hypothetical protein SUTMEG_06200 [Sutterella megalosphaeroides]|uniref:Lipocalin-like domain-containing protein n=1 Tax=Sutterella megalosphaeroides TaxID=2494234 RepID=A0A2Z6I8K5_9BURK|nr:lipocalin family protein [Sutterella megalosphaeroides]BBF22729.1 hypothetical protein SUTMEG_06200 [Sutterella megalosphaeroides]
MPRQTALALTISLLFAGLLSGCGTIADAWDDNEPRFESLERPAERLPAPNVPAPADVMTPAVTTQAPAAAASVETNEPVEAAAPVAEPAEEPRATEPASEPAPTETPAATEPAAETEAVASPEVVRPEDERRREAAALADERAGLPARVDMSATGARKSISWREWKDGKKPQPMAGEAAEPEEKSERSSGFFGSFFGGNASEEPASGPSVTYEATGPSTETVTYGATAPVSEADLAAPAVETAPERVAGVWREAVPGSSRAVRGFDFRADGSAVSFNMGSLDAKRWKLQGSTLTVFGDDTAGGVSVPFALDFDVIESTDTTLAIRQGVLVHRFSKR